MEKEFLLQCCKLKFMLVRNTCVYNYICVSEYVLDLQPFFIRLQAVAIGQALLDAGFLETIAGQPKVFHDDFTLYKPSEV